MTVRIIIAHYDGDHHPVAVVLANTDNVEEMKTRLKDADPHGDLFVHDYAASSQDDAESTISES